MCGIAAIISPNSLNEFRARSQIAVMLETQVRRGPDNAGYYHCRSVFLGHRLLRIIDCPHGAQPMSPEGSGVTISFNGEIYNYRQLRRELQDIGVNFLTQTDTEVLAQLYAQEGVAMLRRLRGMFAFVLHDTRGREILIARDPLGQKPLYVGRRGKEWFLASSISAVNAVVQGAELDRDALQHYLWMLIPPNSTTLLREVELLEPGTFLRLSEGGEIIERGKFGLPDGGSPMVRAQDAAEQFRELLDAAVAEQVSGLDSVAAHLSGGLDSSAIALSLATISNLDVETFSCSYDLIRGEARDDERGFEELHFAQLVAADLKLKNQPVRIAAEDYLFDLVNIVEAIEEPRGNPCLPHFQLARVISKKHRIVLSGEGADELFGGYHWRIGHAYRAQDAELGFWRALLSAPEAVLAHELAEPFRSPMPVMDYVFDQVRDADPDIRLRNFLAFDRRHFLQYLLLQADRLAGRFGMEGRYPFLDPRIVSFAERLPPHLLFAAGQPAKPVIRKALSDRLPTDVLSRPKIGFVAPEGGWYAGRLFGFISELLLHRDSFVVQIFRRGGLQSLLQMHASGQQNLRKLIWALLTLEIWHKRTIEGVSLEALQERVHSLRFPGRNHSFAA